MTQGHARGRSPLRIGINVLFLLPGGVGGTEIYMRSLISALAGADSRNDYFIFRNAETGPDIVPEAPNFHDRPQPVHAASRPARIAFEQTRLLIDVERLKLDIVFNGGFTAPLLCRAPMVTVFYDLQYRSHPQYARWFDRPFWNLLLPASARRSRHIVTLSDSAKRDLTRFYPWAEDRIVLVPHGTERGFQNVAARREARPPSKPMILSVSTLHPHKNIDTLLRAFVRFRERRPEYRLVICGLKGFETERLLRLRAQLQLEGDVDFTGWIPRADLYERFAQTRAFVYPSRFEGFGIPVLEALTAGVPTACSDIPPLREIAGDCARYFDPNDDRAMAAALENVTQDEALRHHLIRAGRDRSSMFTWDKGARRLRDVFERVAAREA
jgi:glycosyltransferase involved in cell wall biosynthesis